MVISIVGSLPHFYGVLFDSPLASEGCVHGLYLSAGEHIVQLPSLGISLCHVIQCTEMIVFTGKPSLFPPMVRVYARPVRASLLTVPHESCMIRLQHRQSTSASQAYPLGLIAAEIRHILCHLVHEITLIDLILHASSHWLIEIVTPHVGIMRGDFLWVEVLAMHVTIADLVVRVHAAEEQIG